MQPATLNRAFDIVGHSETIKKVLEVIRNQKQRKKYHDIYFVQQTNKQTTNSHPHTNKQTHKQTKRNKKNLIDIISLLKHIAPYFTTSSGQFANQTTVKGTNCLKKDI